MFETVHAFRQYLKRRQTTSGTHIFPCFDALPKRIIYRSPPRTLIASMSVL